MRISKFLSSLALLAFVTVPFLKAGDASLEIQMLLKQGLDKNLPLITEKASTLTPEGRSLLYETSKKSAITPFLINLLLGFGIGSYVQGDAAGGTTALIGELLSVGAYGYGAYSVASGNQSTGLAVMAVGIGGLLVFGIYQIVRPFSFEKKYNEKLAGALLNRKVSFQFDMVPRDLGKGEKETQYVAGLTFKF